MLRQISLLLIVSTIVVGCSTPAVTDSQVPETKGQPLSLEEQLAQEKPQLLPVTATTQLGGENIELEVTQTPEQQALGLMFRDRDSLPDDLGMLFSFDPARKVNFWMYNVKIPLDMVFLYQGEVVEVLSNVPPCEAMPCDTYGPEALVDRVIELRGGLAIELGIAVGDRVEIGFLNEP
ncbi:MAG: DUF192 domain-containing protein [Jaaginema sp. PMC 1079.18]|nr:DUF192 domain-containing protein [Jaaginema sp. PMC 1080.18]MEC4850488.1 DUF192 domain-containing protein [Jaaginema sp. PMC 1079.18]MEC4867530.1 DUF192 domain-containing protein [Jaaginema sp. PMC 1078.18]